MLCGRCTCVLGVEFVCGVESVCVCGGCCGPCVCGVESVFVGCCGLCVCGVGSVCVV